MGRRAKSKFKPVIKPSLQVPEIQSMSDSTTSKPNVQLVETPKQVSIQDTSDQRKEITNKIPIPSNILPSNNALCTEADRNLNSSSNNRRKRDAVSVNINVGIKRKKSVPLNEDSTNTSNMCQVPKSPEDSNNNKTVNAITVVNLPKPTKSNDIPVENRPIHLPVQQNNKNLKSSTHTPKTTNTIISAEPLPLSKRRPICVKVKKSKMNKKKDLALKKFKKLPISEDKSIDIDKNIISISDLIYFNPMQAGKVLGMNKPTESQSTITVDSIEKDIINTKEINQNNVPPEPQKFLEDDLLCGVAPQIRLNEDGTIVIDEQSLVIPSQAKETPDLTNSCPVIEDSSFDRVSSSSFARRKFGGSKKWSDEDTCKFYRCLSVVGTDFKLMHLMYKNYSEDVLRRKYKREMKLNPYRIDFALNQQHLNPWSEDMFEKLEDDVHLGTSDAESQCSQTSTTTVIVEETEEQNKNIPLTTNVVVIE